MIPGILKNKKGKKLQNIRDLQNNTTLNTKNKYGILYIIHCTFGNITLLLSIALTHFLLHRTMVYTF